MTATGFHAGAARVSITPPLSAPHAGWGAQTHLYPEGVESDLWATVIVLRNEETQVVLAELDLVILSRAESDAIRDAISSLLGIPRENVRVAVTHNHAGPPPSSWNWMPEGGEALQAYYRALPSLVSGAALSARRNLRPARLGVTRGESQIAINRRETAPNGRVVTGVNPEGPIDPDLLVVRIDGVDGQPIASIVGYTMHPTVMGPTSKVISPDWPGHLKLTVERLTGAPCLFVQGATGDIGPGPEGYTDDVRVARRLGLLIGCDATRLHQSMQVPPREFRHERVWESGAPLGKWTSTELEQSVPTVRAASTTVELPLTEQPPVDEAESAVREASTRLNALLQQGATSQEIEDATFVVKRANMTLSRARTFGGLTTFGVELHATQVSPLMLVGCEGEPFSAIARGIKEQSPFEHTWFGGYTGGWFGYIPTAEEYPRGGYEVETSPYAPEAAGILISRTVEFLQSLAGKP